MRQLAMTNILRTSIDIDKGSPENSSENKDSDLKNRQDLNPLSVVKNLRLKNINKTIPSHKNKPRFN